MTLEETIQSIKDKYAIERNEMDSLSQINRSYNYERMEIVETAKKLFPHSVRLLTREEGIIRGWSLGEGNNGGTHGYMIGEKAFSYKTGMLI
jgi:hypothetical protein